MIFAHRPFRLVAAGLVLAAVAGFGQIQVQREKTVASATLTKVSIHGHVKTPDGRGLVFVARDAGREEAWSTNFDLFLAPLDASAKPKSLTQANHRSRDGADGVLWLGTTSIAQDELQTVQEDAASTL